jgi:hypothetical protein
VKDLQVLGALINYAFVTVTRRVAIVVTFPLLLIVLTAFMFAMAVYEAWLMARERATAEWRN